MMCRDKTPAWFALLHDESYSVASKLGSLLGGEGAGTTNSSSQPTKQWDLLCNEYLDMFETPSGVPDHKIKHRIDLIDENAQPPKLRRYCISSAELAEVYKQLNEYLNHGWLCPNKSPYRAPVLIIHKKKGILRMCIDFRALNKQIKLVAYPKTRIDDILNRLNAEWWLSKIDLSIAYN